MRWLLHSILSMLLIAGCQENESVTVTGRVRDSRTGKGLEGILIVATTSAKSTRSGGNGYYVLSEIIRPDTIIASDTGYVEYTFSMQRDSLSGNRILHNIYLDMQPDTAFTAGGPVDASLFLEHPELMPKKLSRNEAREAVRKLIPEARVRYSELVLVNGKEEWLFEFRYGKAYAAVYIGAYTGDIRSIESEDPGVDKRLQKYVR